MTLSYIVFLKWRFIENTSGERQAGFGSDLVLTLPLESFGIYFKRFVRMRFAVCFRELWSDRNLSIGED